MKKLIALLMLLMMVSTQVLAKTVNLTVNAGDSLSVSALGARSEVRTVTRHVGGLTAADRQWISQQIWEAQEANRSYADEKFASARQEVTAIVDKAMPWLDWTTATWLSLLILLLLMSWFLAWVTGRAMRQPAGSSTPSTITNNLTCPGCTKSCTDAGSNEILLRGPALPGLVLHAELQHEKTTQELHVTGEVDVNLGEFTVIRETDQ